MRPWADTLHVRADKTPPLVLFLCRTNSAVSILAEATLRHFARGRVRAASMGDTAARCVSPYALECLASHRIDTEGLRSKPWGEFFGLGRPPVHVLITLCDPDASYAARVNWDQGTVRTVKAHWPTPEPEAVVGSETDKRLAFEETFVTLEARIRQFLALSPHRLTHEALSRELGRIGEVYGDLI